MRIYKIKNDFRDVNDLTALLREYDKKYFYKGIDKKKNKPWVKSKKKDHLVFYCGNRRKKQPVSLARIKF
jgi:hypothetical protein